MMTAQAVLDFWFGVPSDAEFGKTRAAWFRKDRNFDAAISNRFRLLVEHALAGRLREWDARPGSALARIVVLDQFTRNIFRDTAHSFAGDGLAVEAAQAMLSRGCDATLLPVQRSFVYLPFEHAEDVALQDRSVALFSALAAQAPELHDMLAYAHKHRDVIRRFGRFPHRNACLRRRSTEQERDYLAQPGSGF